LEECLKHLFLLMLTPVFLGVPFASAADKETVAEAVTAVVEAESSASETKPLAPEKEPLESETLPNSDGVIDPVVTPESTSAAEVSVADVQLPFDLKAAADLTIDTFGGEVVKAEETPDEAGLLFFTIRIVNEGRVKDVVIDAANGDIIKPLEEPVTPESEPVAVKEETPVTEEAAQ
jgi:uncharacterized membrane protein YkoI